MTDERVAWLTARLDELECTARAAEQAPWMTLFDEDRADGLGTVYSIAGRVSRVVAEDVTPGDGALITLNDPRAVLARVEADRRVLTRHAQMSGGACEHCWSNEWHESTWPCDDFRDLLAAHRYAPGFRDQWLSGS